VSIPIEHRLGPVFGVDGCRYEAFSYDGSRYHFDTEVCQSSRGWHQYDTEQDAWYFGVWVNPELRAVLTYAEGDITLEAFTPAAFARTLKRMAEFYGTPPPAFRVIDCETGQTTHVYDKRALFGREVPGL